MTGVQTCGSSDLPIRADVRIVAATNRNLRHMVRQGLFREDLFFRLSVFELELPPLRRRKEDIPALVQSFIRQHREAAGSRVTNISASALGRLLEYEWPGNIRELQNVVQRCMVLADGEDIGVKDLPDRLFGTSAVVANAGMPLESGDSSATLEDVSKKLLVAALTKHEGNASAAMRELNIGRTRFYRMLRKFDLEGKIEEIRARG